VNVVPQGDQRQRQQHDTRMDQQRAARSQPRHEDDERQDSRRDGRNGEDDRRLSDALRAESQQVLQHAVLERVDV
jgi:hypothetical protein